MGAMIRSRPKPKVKGSSAPLSDDQFDKFVAAMSGYVGKNKNDPDYSRAPHYYAAVAEWFGRLPLDQQELVHIVVHIYTTLSYGGEALAMTYAAGLPSVPAPPELIRKARRHDSTSCAKPERKIVVAPSYPC
jgi:hypothetical protein